MINKTKLPKQLEVYLNSNLMFCAMLDLTIKAKQLKTPEDLRCEWFMSELSGLIKPRMTEIAYNETMDSFGRKEFTSITNYQEHVNKMLVTLASHFQDYLRDEIDFF